jgi:hypothetical protein
MTIPQLATVGAGCVNPLLHQHRLHPEMEFQFQMFLNIVWVLSP